MQGGVHTDDWCTHVVLFGHIRKENQLLFLRKCKCSGRYQVTVSKAISPKDHFLLCEDDEMVLEELARRQKGKSDRDKRRDRSDQSELDKEEKWKQLHMNMASSRTALSICNE